MSNISIIVLPLIAFCMTILGIFSKTKITTKLDGGGESSRLTIWGWLVLIAALVLAIANVFNLNHSSNSQKLYQELVIKNLDDVKLLIVELSKEKDEKGN